MLLAHGAHGTPRSELAFLTYAELGYGRSLARLAEKLGKSVGKTRVRLPTLESWSAKYHWQERVKLYDQERAEERRREQEAAIDTMNGEHASMAYNAAQLAAQQIRELMEEKRF